MIRINDEPIAWEVDLLEKRFFGIHNLSFDQRDGKNIRPVSN